MGDKGAAGDFWIYKSRRKRIRISYEFEKSYDFPDGRKSRLGYFQPGNEEEMIMKRKNNLPTGIARSGCVWLTTLSAVDDGKLQSPGPAVSEIGRPG